MIEKTHFNLQLTFSFYKYVGKEAKYVETRTEDKASIDRIDAKLVEGMSNSVHSCNHDLMSQCFYYYTLYTH